MILQFSCKSVIKDLFCWNGGNLNDIIILNNVNALIQILGKQNRCEYTYCFICKGNPKNDSSLSHLIGKLKM